MFELVENLLQLHNSRIINSSNIDKKSKLFFKILYYYWHIYY